MKIRAATFLFSIFSAAMAHQASAISINGLSYKLVSGLYGSCPDGNAKYIYNGKPYCRTYKASLSWNIPTTRVNGVGLMVSELRGYEVYWTRSSDATSGTIKVSGGTSQTAALEVFKPDQYYFAVSAIDITSLKSPLSPVMSARLGQ